MESNGVDDIITIFNDYSLKNPDMPKTVAAIKALTDSIETSSASTMMELKKSLEKASDVLKSTSSNFSLMAACDLFLSYVTRCFLEFTDFEQSKRHMINRGKEFENTSRQACDRICYLGHDFIRDGMVVFTHGNSRIVTALLVHAAKRKHFSVIITQSISYTSDGNHYVTADVLSKAGIPVTVTQEAAMGYWMDSVDVVLVGAEGVVENGGIVNKIGTFTCALAAKAMGKPFYVAAESFKFTRLFPLNQRDFPKQMQKKVVLNNDQNSIHENSTPCCDYTPPEYITSLFTDLGVLTPSAVCDELIELYK